MQPDRVAEYQIARRNRHEAVTRLRSAASIAGDALEFANRIEQGIVPVLVPQATGPNAATLQSLIEKCHECGCMVETAWLFMSPEQQRGQLSPEVP